MYIQLCGYPPFNGNTDEEIIESVKKANVVFYDEEWKNISESAKNLISRLLTYNPYERISVKQAYFHEWIQGHINISTLIFQLNKYFLIFELIFNQASILYFSLIL